MFAGGQAFAAFFVGQREIEMHVGVRGHGAGGAAEMLDGFIELAEFFQGAAQVVTRNAVERVDLHGAEEGVARVGEVAELVIGDAEIDVRFDPVGGEFDDTLIILDGLRQSFGAGFAIERGAEKILGRGPGQRVKFGRLRRHIERESPLFQERIKRKLGTRRHHVNFAAEVDQAKLVQRHGGGAELFFDQGHGASYFAGWDVILSQTLQGAKRDEIDEAVKTLAPAGFGADEA